METPKLDPKHTDEPNPEFRQTTLPGVLTNSMSGVVGNMDKVGTTGYG